MKYSKQILSAIATVPEYVKLKATAKLTEATLPSPTRARRRRSRPDGRRGARLHRVHNWEKVARHERRLLTRVCEGNIVSSISLLPLFHT